MIKKYFTTGILTTVAQILGFWKLGVISEIFGIGPELDGYNLAISFAILVPAIISNLMQTAVFALYTREIFVNYEKQQDFFEIFGGFTLVTVVLVFFLMLLVTPLVFDSMTGSSDPAVNNYFRYVWPYAVLVGLATILSDAISYLLALCDKFYVSGVLTILNLFFAVILLKIWPEGGIFNLSIGTFLGLFVQVTFGIFYLFRNRHIKLRFIETSGYILKFAKNLWSVAGWHLPGIVVSNVLLQLPIFLLRDTASGVVSTFGYASKIHGAIAQTIVMSISTLVLADFTKYICSKNYNKIIYTTRAFVIVSLLLSSLASICIFYLGESALGFAFGGKFSASDAELVTTQWFLLSLGLCPLLVGTVYAKYWQASGMSKVLSFHSFFGLVSFLISYVFFESLGIDYPVTAAMSLGLWIVMISGSFFTAVIIKRAFKEGMQH